MGTKICLRDKNLPCFWAWLRSPRAAYVDCKISFLQPTQLHKDFLRIHNVGSNRNATQIITQQLRKFGQGYRVVNVIMVSSFRSALSFQTWMRGPCQPRPNEVCQKPLLSATHSEASLVDRVMINDERAVLPIVIKHTHIHIQSDTNMYSKGQHNANIYMIYINIILTMTMSICTKYLSSHSTTSTAHCHSPTEKGYRWDFFFFCGLIIVDYRSLLWPMSKV